MKMPFAIIGNSLKDVSATGQREDETDFEFALRSARVALSSKRYDDALDSCSHAFALLGVEGQIPDGRPTPVPALHFIQGCAYRELGRLEEARTELMLVASTERFGLGRSARKLLASM